MFCVEEIQRVCVCARAQHVCVLFTTPQAMGKDTNPESELDIVLGAKTVVLSENVHPRGALFWVVHGN